MMLNLTSFGFKGDFCKCFQINPKNIVDTHDLEAVLFNETGITSENYYFVYNGKIVNDNVEIGKDEIIHVVPKLIGGKGGFGSMLRAIGAQIEKTTNREACRDLSGRRLRDINEEQRLKNWIAHQAEREREAAERKQKKLERLCREPKHDFKDDDYNQARSELAEKVNDSVEQGFKASTSGSGSLTGTKRKESDSSIKDKKKKKKKLWIDAEEDDTSSGESNDEDVAASNTCKSVLPSESLDKNTPNNSENETQNGSQIVKTVNNS